MRRYRHECVFYGGTGGFLDAALPFVRDGLARREPVMVAVAEPRLQALRSALGDDAGDVMFADMAQLGRNPAHRREHGPVLEPVVTVDEATVAQAAELELPEQARGL